MTLREAGRADGERRPRPPPGAASPRLQGPRNLTSSVSASVSVRRRQKTVLHSVFSSHSHSHSHCRRSRPMRILITGITGFVGGHLVEHLVAAGGHALVGVSRRGQWPAPLAHLAAARRTRRGRPARPGRGRARPPRRPPRVGDPPRRLRQHRRLVQGAGPGWADNLTATRSLYDALAATGVRAARAVRLHRAGVRRAGPPGRRVRRADHAQAGQPVRGQQGRRRPGQLPVHPQRRPGHRPRPAVQPDRPAAERRLRGAELRPPDRRRRGRYRSSRWWRPATCRRSATSPTCATWSPAFPLLLEKGVTRRGVQRRPAARRSASRTCSTGWWRWPASRSG